MDADQALADLTEISSQVVDVAIVEGGALLASTFEDAGAAERFVGGALRLLEEADRVSEARGLAALSQLEAATLDGSVFVVRRGGRVIAAATRPDPTVGLVFYDLKHCLRSLEAPVEDAAPSEDAEPAEETKPRRRKAKADAPGPSDA